MPIDSEAKKLLGGKWADSGDRTDPDDASLTPALDRDTGWPATFSATNGNTPRRRVFNQLFREQTGVAVDTIQRGVLEWDADVDYLANAIVQSNGVLYLATVATGPDTSNATDPQTAGQMIWDTITGEASLPAAPAAPTATSPASGELFWTWNCPLDGGNVITSFNVQWRQQGGTWSASISRTTATYSQTGRDNALTYELRVQAITSLGTGPWSTAGSASPSATVPGGGVTLALRATAGDTEIDLDWLEPDTGGATIAAYTIQWRESGQAFSSAREQTSTTNSATVDTLTNGTEYFFQVRATNSVGDGPWSNETSATPAAPVPRRVRLTTSQTYSWPYDEVENAVINLQADAQIAARAVGDDISLAVAAWSGGVSDGTTLWFVNNTADTAVAYTASSQARQSGSDISLGTGSWNGGVSDGTTLWFVNGTNQMAVAYAASDQSRQSGSDISLGVGSWNGGASDGTTLWFVNDTTNTAVAYAASNQARQSGSDISLGTGAWQGGASDGTTLWFIENNSNMAVAYAASNQARLNGIDLSLVVGSNTGGVFADNTLWFIEPTADTAVAYSLPVPTTVTTGGQTYRSAVDGDAWFDLQSIADSQDFVLAIGTNGMLDIYPQG